MSLRLQLDQLPVPLGESLASTYDDLATHMLAGEFDDAQVDGGRFCEAALRYLELKMTGDFTVIDGRSKPNRKSVVQAARQDTTLPPSLRAQVPQAIELVMDFRNNRNSAHLGNINPNEMDAACVAQNVSWVLGEIARIESGASPAEIQLLLGRLARRRLPVVQMVGETPIVLDPRLEQDEQILLLLYQAQGPVPSLELRHWVGHSHATRWRDKVLAPLVKERLIYVDSDSRVHLLIPGEDAARRLIGNDGWPEAA